MSVASKTKAKPKAGLVRLSVYAIRPSPENELLYRPVSTDDPEIRKLADSITERGLLEPLVITTDRYILSGHRRHAACRLAGVTEVDCRIVDVTRSDPRFEVLLREFNRQRVKSFDEVVREIAISDNPDDAYACLLQQRKEAAAVSGDFLVLGEEKFRKGFSKGKMPMLLAVIRIINDQREYWPLSDRSIHYDILNDPPLKHAGKPESRYRNDKTSYRDLTDLLCRGRIAGQIPFDAIADPTRTVQTWSLHRGAGDFVETEMDWFLSHYSRDLQQSQPNHIEIVGEKNTVEGSIKNVAMEYCIPYTLGRGFCSIGPRKAMIDRFKASGKENLIVLFMSDFDPEGEEIPYSFARSLRDDFGIDEDRIRPMKVSLTYNQVIERGLPRTFEIKKKSSRYPKFAAKYGDRAHELEALPSAVRSELLEEAICGVMDIDAYNAEVDAEKADAARIASLRERLRPLIASAMN